MSQNLKWDKEYSEKRMLTAGVEPQAAFLKYLRYLKKRGYDISNMKILDLGSGTGRNSNYLSSLGGEVVGMETSSEALRLAMKRGKAKGLNVMYLDKSIGDDYPFEDNNFDLVIDVTSSNSLDNKEREVYLNEVERVMKKGGNFFVRALLKDGDKNAKNLLKILPGKEPDTYVLPKLNITERVFSEQGFVNLYSSKFIIDKIIKTSGYAKIDGVIYKRKYIIGYFIK